jgi:hypothetical protein
MSSNAGIPLHGYLEGSHISTANSQYAPNNIPTPWPLVLFSVLFSFIICCIAAVPGAISLDGNASPLQPPAPAQPVVASTTTPGNKQTNIALQPLGAKGPTLKIPKVKWRFPFLWLCYYITVLYCTFRAVSAIYLCLETRIYNKSPLPAPSTVLLALIATQIVHCNFNHHPITRLILTLDILALSISFGFCSYLLGTSGWSRYGTLFLAGGNCPVPASDCRVQAAAWLSVGCDQWTSQPWSYMAVSSGSPQQFNIPYSVGGNINDVNSLRNTEEGVIIIGTIWFFFAFSQLCDVFNILADIFSGSKRTTSTFGRQKSVSTGLLAIFAQLHPRRLFTPKKSKVRTDIQRNMYYWIIGAGILVAALTMCMGIGGHAYQMNNKQKAEYLDCFGPAVGTNLTFNSQGVLVGTHFTGNATSWCDCFEIRAPGSKSGFWSEWVAQNSHSGSLYRIAGGL